MTYDFYYKVKVKGHYLGYYPVKLLKRFRFVQKCFHFLASKIGFNNHGLNKWNIG